MEAHPPAPHSTTPLLARPPGTSAIATNTATTKPFHKEVPLSALQRFAVNTFSTLRLLRGLSFIVYPSLGLSSFDIPPNGATFLLGTLLGTRDLLLGGLLFTSQPVVGREIYRALLVNLLSDAMDTCVLIFSAVCAWHWRTPAIEIVAVAVMALCEHLTLFSMSTDDYEHGGYGDGGEAGGYGRRAMTGSMGYQKMLQASEDKRNRLDTWMDEMRKVEESRMLAASPKPSSLMRE